MSEVPLNRLRLGLLYVHAVLPPCVLTPPTIRWAMTLSSEVNSHHTIDCGALCGAALVTSISCVRLCWELEEPKGPKGRGGRKPRSPPCGIWKEVEPGRCRANMARQRVNAKFLPWLSSHFLWAENENTANPGAGFRGTSLKEPRPHLQGYLAHKKQLPPLGPP